MLFQLRQLPLQLLKKAILCYRRINPSLPQRSPLAFLSLVRGEALLVRATVNEDCRSSQQGVALSLGVHSPDSREKPAIPMVMPEANHVNPGPAAAAGQAGSMPDREVVAADGEVCAQLLFLCCPNPSTPLGPCGNNLPFRAQARHFHSLDARSSTDLATCALYSLQWSPNSPLPVDGAEFNDEGMFHLCMFSFHPAWLQQAI